MLTPVFRLIPFIFGIGLLGLATQILFFRTDSSKSGSIFELFSLRMISGFATAVAILVLALCTNCFYKPFLILMALSVMVCAAIRWHRIRTKLHWIGYFFFCLGLTIVSMAVSLWTKPYEAMINSSDASVYVAFGFSIANSGTVEYKDAMMSEMTEQEKELFFDKGENTYARFRGGVILRDKIQSVIAFSFLPLFSAWLALGILLLGSSSFVYLLSFQIVLGCIALYWIGHKLAGPLLGISIPFALFFFLPEFYFLRLPFSEGFAQTLFVCGLFSFLIGSSKQNQVLTGVLWGSIFLCRIEVMFTCLISILLLFTISPEYKNKWRKYEAFLLTVAFSLLLSFYWMLTKRVYLDVWGLRDHYVIKNLWLPFVLSLSDAMRSHPLAGAVAYAAASGMLLLILRRILNKTADERFGRYLSFAVFVFTGSIFVCLIAFFTNWPNLAEHFVWTFVYFQPWILALLLGSFVILFFVSKIPETSQLTWTILLLLLPAAILFLARPLIVPQQPLYIRRCIPVVFPLFLILTLQNWLLIFRSFLKTRGVSSSLFAIFAVVVTGTFLIDTVQLIRTPLFAGVIDQIGMMGDNLPPNALVIIPANEAGIHMELPLQYSLGRDTITIPDQEFEHLLASFLKRQLAQNRPVFLLTTRKNTAANPLPQLKLERIFKGQMIFRTLSPSKPDLVPYRLRTEVLRYEGFKFVSPESTARDSAL